jgi:phage anti-repressor protein
MLSLSISQKSSLKNKLTTLIKNGSSKMLSINSFIDKMNYDIDKFYINKYWHNLNDDYPILIDDLLIKSIGYNNSEERCRKQDFLKLLKTNNIQYQEYAYNEYIEMVEEINIKEEVYPIPEKTINISKRKFILMNVEDFKQAAMLCNTNQGKLIRKYYIKLEKIIKEYSYYQMLYEKSGRFKTKQILLKISDQNNHLIEQNKAQNIKIDKLLNQNIELKEDIDIIDKKLDIATEERSLKPVDKSLWHKLIIIDLNDVVEGNYKDINYYTIRAQRKTAISSYKKFRNMPKVYETEDFEGNAINLYNRIKEYFDDRAIFNKNTIKLKNNIDHHQFSGELVDYCISIKEEFET